MAHKWGYISISPLLYISSWIVPVCLALCCLRCSHIAFNLSRMSQMLNVFPLLWPPLSLAAGVRSNRCGPLPVGVGRRSALLLRSSRSLSFTTRSWNINNEHWASLITILPLFCFFPPSLWPLTTPSPHRNFLFHLTDCSLFHLPVLELDLTRPLAQDLCIELKGNNFIHSLFHLHFPLYNGPWDILSGTYRRLHCEDLVQLSIRTISGIYMAIHLKTWD